MKIENPHRLLIILMAAIFMGEGLIMLILPYLTHHQPVWVEGMVDGLLLVFILFPFLYIFIYMPFISEIENRKETEKELREKLDELERLRKATMEREFRIMELKEEIKTLKEGFHGK